MSDRSSTEIYDLKVQLVELKAQLEEARQQNEYLQNVLSTKALGEGEFGLTDEKNIFTILSNNINGICWIANKERLLFVNDAYERIFEVPSDALYQDFLAFMVYAHPDDKEKVDRISRRLFNYEGLVHFQHRIITPTGRLKWLDTQVIPTEHEEYGSLIVGISSDTTDIYKQRQELEFAKEKAEESDRLKSAFLANMSHEIRTPLNGIIGFAELLIDPDVSMDEKMGFSEIIQECSQQLMSIVNEVLELSQIETRQVKVEEEATDLNSILLDVFNIIHPQATRKGLDLKIATDSAKIKEKVKLDKTKLKRILVNLTENAVKFTQKGEIVLGYKLVKEELQFFVQDTGVGIPMHEQKTIFDSFHRGQKAEKERYRGAGLGLTISKAFAELMKGTIRLQSAINEGSTFYVYLPCQVVQTQTKPKPIITTIPDLNEYTILIVEDEQMNYFLLLNALSRTKADILWAKNGFEAVKISQENSSKIDLVLMDIMMPEMDGIEATKQIKKFAPQLPIIAQTACSLAEDKQRILAAGCDDYLSKPLNKDKLFQLLGQYLIYN